MSQEVEILKNKSTSDKSSKLVLSIIFDLLGMLSYVIPVFGETIDVVWAPVSGLLLVAMYKGITGKVAGIIGFIEEAFPLFLDFIPTFTLTWIYKYVISKED